MASLRTEIERLGTRRLIPIAASLFYWWKRNGSLTRRLIRTVPFRKWRSLEVAGENIWAFFCGFYLARRFQELEIGHIHAPWANGPATAAWIASKLTGIPFSFTGRAVDIHPPDGALEEKMADATFIRTNTATNVVYLKKFLTDGSKKIYLTYNGYPLKNFQPAAVAMKEPLRILAVGRFARFKGFNVLLRSAVLMKKEKRDFRLIIAGSGWRVLYFKLFCRCYRLSDNVSFPGFIAHDRISDLYARADIFVLPSVIHPSGERDGIPNVLMEALLHGLPVVSTSLAPVREVIENGVAGLLVPPGDASALAHAIIKMAGNRERALNLARNGKRKILELFDPEKNHRQLLEIYRQSFFSH
jgi:glycosyltransferase involved in cell wall biosynthesis